MKRMFPKQIEILYLLAFSQYKLGKLESAKENSLILNEKLKKIQDPEIQQANKELLENLKEVKISESNDNEELHEDIEEMEDKVEEEEEEEKSENGQDEDEDEKGKGKENEINDQTDKMVDYQL